MAEDDALGDFFAKKDKSKKPKKKKKTKTETVITQSDNQAAQVEEWKDFEEQKEKDFSNLKMADLQGGEEGEKEEQDSQQNEDDMIEGEEGSDAQAVWRASQLNGNTAPQIQPTRQAPPTEPTAGSHNVVGNKYVPPSMKRATMSSGARSAPRRKGAPPDINNQAAFPTLSASQQEPEPSDFSMVRKGIRHDGRHDENSQVLETGNRFQGLSS